MLKLNVESAKVFVASAYYDALDIPYALIFLSSRHSSRMPFQHRSGYL
jgi:hypothetical protein